MYEEWCKAYCFAPFFLWLENLMCSLSEGQFNLNPLAVTVLLPFHGAKTPSSQGIVTPAQFWFNPVNASIDLSGLNRVTRCNAYLLIPVIGMDLLTKGQFGPLGIYGKPYCYRGFTILWCFPPLLVLSPTTKWTFQLRVVGINNQKQKITSQ